jgi:hypothetical protein
MTSRITSAISRHRNSMRRPNIGGLKDTIQALTGSDGTYGSNEYIHKNFFDEENYQSIIKCLDGGHEISTDLLEYMQDYYDLLQDFIHRLTSYSNKWKSKLKHQSSLSSYHTTKRAQIQTVRSPEKLAQLLQARCDAIQPVISKYKKQVEKMYPSERLSTVRKHYRTDVMKKLFKNAHSPLIKLSEKLEKLHEQEKRAQKALLDAKIQCQNLGLDETTSKNKLTRANDHQETKQSELQAIQDKIARIEKEYNQERETYLEKATEIYQQCRELEQERLDQIRQTLIEFTQATNSSEYSSEQDAIYEDLLLKIKTEQDTLVDLDFWAQTYHVNILTKSISSESNQNDDHNENIESQTTTQKTKKSPKNEAANLTTIEENTTQSVVEDQEEKSVADKTSTSAKTKPKKKKNNTAEPTTPDTK